ncbi:MAG TPA: hypothetical protein VJ570_01005 [Holophagaceae bacterium]|nr:hypothetical protein [Holophagaceae bacterium]
MNLVVARFRDGRLVKGQTNDFLPNKDAFHLLPEEAAPGSKAMEVRVAELKALFFVKALKGDSVHAETNRFDPFKPTPPGRKLRVVFADGEELIGTTQGYQPDRPGFFLVPADARSNNERCFVVKASTRSVEPA